MATGGEKPPVFFLRTGAFKDRKFLEAPQMSSGIFAPDSSFFP